MKLVVERTGGFAGMTRRGERDGSTLSAEQLAALRKLMESSSKMPPDPGAAASRTGSKCRTKTGPSV